jgi:hypothetical protein
MKDKLINLTIDDQFRNPFHWGKFKYEPDYKVLTRLETDWKEYNRKKYGVIYYKTWNPFEDNNLVILFIFFHHWKKKWIFKVKK